MIEKLRAKWEKSGLKSWTAGKIHLSRGKKLALDLVIIVLAGGWLWGLAGCPLPTVEMGFRRLERQYLLPRSEVAYQIGFWSFGGGGDIKSRDGTYLSVFEPLVVGVTGGRAYSVTLRRPGWHDVSVISLGEGPAPVPLNGTVARVPEPGRTWMSGCNLLFLRVPQETVRAELDMDARFWDDEHFTRRVQEGLCLEDGVWLFSLEPPEGGYPGDWYEGATYTLRLYREDGGLLLERSGIIEIC